MENKSINQLMGTTFSDATEQSSYLVKRVAVLCNMPIPEFDVEDFRLLINQGIALDYLVSPAIEILSENLFAEGDYYEGDLLKSLLTISDSFWNKNPDLEEKMRRIIQRDFGTIETLELSDSIKENLRALVKSFMNRGNVSI